MHFKFWFLITMIKNSVVTHNTVVNEQLNLLESFLLDCINKLQGVAMTLCNRTNLWTVNHYTLFVTLDYYNWLILPANSVKTETDITIIQYTVLFINTDFYWVINKMHIKRLKNVLKKWTEQKGYTAYSRRSIVANSLFICSVTTGHLILILHKLL